MRADGPINTTTPMNPSPMPIQPRPDSRSLLSLVNMRAVSAVQRGVVAIKIEANPPVIRVCAFAISSIGIRLFNAPITKKDAQSERLRGIRYPAALVITSNATDAIADRDVMMMRGEVSRSAASLKRNDPPHNRESNPSRSHEEVEMVPSASDGRGMSEVLSIRPWYPMQPLLARRFRTSSSERGSTRL